LLYAVCCLLSAVCCLMSAVCCLLSAVCCLLSAVCCLLSVVGWMSAFWCLLSCNSTFGLIAYGADEGDKLPTVCYLAFAICCLLSAVCCLLSAVCCSLSAVWCLMFAVWSLLSHFCCLLPAVVALAKLCNCFYYSPFTCSYSHIQWLHVPYFNHARLTLKINHNYTLSTPWFQHWIDAIINLDFDAQGWRGRGVSRQVCDEKLWRHRYPIRPVL
jgi:hypothetical protein